jgi:hypothetical protein
VRGTLRLSGNVAVDGAGGAPACGGDARYGALSGEATSVTGPVMLAGGAGGLAQHQPPAALDALTLSPAVLDTLRVLAMRRGTYYGPGFPRGGPVSDGAATWDGRVVFDGAHPLQDGLVFVDAADGRTPQPGAPLDGLATARLEAGAAPGGTFRGWLVVNGALEIAGGLRLRGLVYAVDALTYRAPGAGSIEGLAVSLNAREPVTRLEALAGGGLSVTLDCEQARGAGAVPRGFTLVPGTYREERD